MFGKEFKKIDFGLLAAVLLSLFSGLLIARTLPGLTAPLANFYFKSDDGTEIKYILLPWALFIFCETACLISYIACFYFLKKPFLKKPLSFIFCVFLALNLAVTATYLLTDMLQGNKSFPQNSYGQGLLFVYIVGINIISLISTMLLLFLGYILQKILIQKKPLLLVFCIFLALNIAIITTYLLTEMLQGDI